MATPLFQSLSTGGFYVLADGGYYRLSGEDRRAFLQRQTTNQIDLLQPDRSLLSVLTSPTARILDVFVLLDEGDAIGVLTLPGRATSTYKYLRSRIFFNDRVSIEDASRTTMQIDVFGAQAEAALEQIGVDGPLEVNQSEAAAGNLRCIRLDPAFGLGYRLLLPSASAQDVETALVDSGLACFLSTDYNSLRVEKGLPSADHELTDDYTPIEAGLLAAVSDSKGCYTGQEVIPRQITYDKVTRMLCGLHLGAPAEPGTELFSQGGVPAGRLTSIADSPRLGRIGLGVVKRPNNQAGSILRVGADGGVARVTVLPFQP